jgi:hypothetical protein
MPSNIKNYLHFLLLSLAVLLIALPMSADNNWIERLGVFLLIFTLLKLRWSCKSKKSKIW